MGLDVIEKVEKLIILKKEYSKFKNEKFYFAVSFFICNYLYWQVNKLRKKIRPLANAGSLT